jgi:NADPH2 dehydrogenase
MTAALFQPLQLRELTLANRVIVSPMCQYSAELGSATDWHVMHLGSMTQSSAGLVLIEATAVAEQARITPGCLGLWNDANEAALKRVLDAIRPHANTRIGIQLAHAGRKASSAAPWQGGLLMATETAAGGRRRRRPCRTGPTSRRRGR